ncbi:effector binding domain-containing protein [Paenisporosarcina cavernae]|uniref:Helix-turn-helix domain-containing protein n=1 Tax=Paenisporosarcina cavernae TaxID=2320858 RepID=A0A385YUQ1_9BACL|nr:effector binding domain-containing protein [Paenisporosarcina cavernae]AYC30284.1 helix-turn-helix domain-containing protein [Paenisporosarcina cavernae]
MAWVESIQKAIDYMEKNLMENLTIDSIAKQANVSAFHFQRTFSVLTDITVGDYIRRRRLTLAGEELLTTDTKVIDIAHKYGYETPEAFSKAFRRQHNLTPSDLRKSKGKLQSYNRLMIQVTLKGANPMKYSVIEKNAFQIVGIKREFSSVAEEENVIGIPELWEEVNHNGTCDQLFQLNDGVVKGVLGVCGEVSKEQKDVNVFDYWVATSYAGEVPNGMLSLELPASKWAVFEVHGPMPTAMQNAWKQIFSEWFPSTGYQHAGTPEFELYSDEDPNSPDLYSEIWIPIK